MTELEKEEIYRQFYRKVLAYLRGKLNDPDVAEDLCADVFLKVFAHADDYNPQKASLSTWIYTVARNTLYDYFRTSNALLPLEETVPDGSDVEDDLCRDETLEQLADALQCLPEKERDVILLHYYEGLTLKATAERMGYSYSYIKMLHNSGLNHLKKSFDGPKIFIKKS